MNLPEHIALLSPSKNAEVALLELARQIANRDELEIQEVLSDSYILEVCSREKLGRKDKLKLVRAKLEQIRFPLLKDLESRLERCKKAIQKELGLTLELPAQLEGDTISLRLKFRSEVDVLNASKKLGSLAKMDQTKEIFSILSGEI